MSNGRGSPRPAFGISFPPTPHGLPPWSVRALGGLVLSSLLLQYGFHLSEFTGGWLNWVDVALALGLTVDLGLALRKERTWRRAWELRRIEYLLLAGALVLAALAWVLPSFTLRGLLRFLHLDSESALTLSLLKLFLLLSVCIQLLRTVQTLLGRNVRPELVLAASFAVLILLGTLLLLLPNSSAKSAAPISGVDAVFTATSAVCVTGLVVRATGTDFSNFGQMVILVLIQVGGLGIITFVGFLSIVSSRALPVPQMVVFRQIVNAPELSEVRRQIVGILLITAVIESMGAVLVYWFLPGSGDALGRIKWSVFHSVSAFCNAGFALQSDSLIAFRTNAGLTGTILALIVLGGLGFLVIPELLSYRLTRTRFFRRLAFFHRWHVGQVPGRLSVQTKLSVQVTIVLLVSGFVLFWLIESHHALRGRSMKESILAAGFQAVTPRTAGFNTVPIGELQEATLVLMMILMAVGASPVSTGGGIKTVSLGILLLAMRSLVFRRERVEAFGRTIPLESTMAALSVFVLYVLIASIGIFLLALGDPQMQLRDQAFEAVSALSTVGLSTGITPGLSTSSKLVLCGLMFVGRVGPISLVLSIFHRHRVLEYELPEENVVVG